MTMGVCEFFHKWIDDLEQVAMMRDILTRLEVVDP